MKKIYISCLILVLLSFASCQKKEDETIYFDDSEPLALAPDVEWAVVNDPYAAYKSEIGWESSVIGHSRKGDILRVLGKSVDKNNEVWYSFENGWLSGSCLLIYSNRFKAQTVSKNLLDSEK